MLNRLGKRPGKLSRGLRSLGVTSIFVATAITNVSAENFEPTPLMIYGAEFVDTIGEINRDLKELAAEFDSAAPATSAERQVLIEKISQKLSQRFEVLSNRQSEILKPLAEEPQAFARVLRQFQKDSLSYLAELAGAYRPAADSSDHEISRLTKQNLLLVEWMENLAHAYLQSRVSHLVFPSDPQRAAMAEFAFLSTEDHADKALIEDARFRYVGALVVFKDSLRELIRKPVATHEDLWTQPHLEQVQYFSESFRELRYQIRELEAGRRRGELRNLRNDQFAKVMEFWEEVSEAFVDLQSLHQGNKRIAVEIDPILVLSAPLATAIESLHSSFVEIGSSRNIIQIGDEISNSMKEGGRVNKSLSELDLEMRIWLQEIYELEGERGLRLSSSNSTLQRLFEEGCLIC
jgi:hypothetical protein